MIDTTTIRPYDFSTADATISAVHASARFVAATPVALVIFRRDELHEFAASFRGFAESLRGLEENVRDLTRRFEKLQRFSAESGQRIFSEEDAASFLTFAEAPDHEEMVETMSKLLCVDRLGFSSELRMASRLLSRAMLSFRDTSAKHRQAVRDAVLRCYDATEHEAALSPEAAAALDRGIADAKAGRVSSVGSFAQYLDS